MIGPAATPRKKTTPIIVPKTKATVTCGSEAINPTPFDDKTATKTPQKIAIQPSGDLNIVNKSLIPIWPVAIGIRILIVIIITPKFIPFVDKIGNIFFDKGKSLMTSTTAVAMIRLLFLAIIAIIKINNRNSQLSMMKSSFQ